MGKTLRRYLLREIGGAFLAGIAIFSSILFLLRAIDLIEMIFARGVPAALVARLLGAILPSLVEVTLPMAFLLAVVTALGRMASDRETLALRAAGLNVWQVLPPVLVLAAIVSVASLALSMTARPWGHTEIEHTLFEIARTRASAALKPRFFNTEFERMVVYVDRIEPDTGDLVGVLLSDERGSGERSTVFASMGRVGGHADSGRLYLQLLEGTSVTSRENYADYDVTKFRSLEVSLELRTATGGTPANDEPAAMGWNELKGELGGPDQARAREASIELHRRFSIAAAAVSFGLFGAALGFVTSATTRGRSVGTSIAIILGYYAALMFGVGLARVGTLPAAAALWTPNAVLAALAVWSLSRNARDLPVLPARSRAARFERSHAA